MAAATGGYYPQPAMTWAFTPNPNPEPIPKPMNDPSLGQSSEISATARSTTGEVPAFGWSGYAERVNGRFAMVGFIAVLLIEALSGEIFLRWAGLVP